MKLGLIFTAVTIFAVGCFDGAALDHAKDYDPPMANAHRTRETMPRPRYRGIEVGPFDVTQPVKLATRGAVKAKLPPAIKHVVEHFGTFHDCYTRPLEQGGPGNVTACDVD